MASGPQFRMNEKGEVILQRSDEATAVKNQYLEDCRNKIKPPPVLSSEGVESKARHVVLSKGGNVNNRIEVLGEFTLQRYQYRGKSFKWVLENDPAYASYLLRGEAPPDLGKGGTAKWN